MFNKIPCDWYLNDGIYPSVRLEAPEYVAVALKRSGVLCEEQLYEQRSSSEWIYRRRWSYVASFSLEKAGKRLFMKVTRLLGSWSIYINEQLCASGNQAFAEFETASHVVGKNELRITFDMPPADEMCPEFGFAGAVMMRYASAASLTDLDCRRDSKDKTCIYMGVECIDKQSIELKLKVNNASQGETEALFKGELEGSNKLKYAIDDLPEGEISRITAHLLIGGQQSDEISAEFLPVRHHIPVRGFVCDSESTIASAAEAGANAVFTTDETVDGTARMVASRHMLPMLSVQDRELSEAPSALTNSTHLMEIAGTVEELDKNMLWALTKADKAPFDAAEQLMPNGSVDEIVTYSRIAQAEKLRQQAFKYRVEGKPFILNNVDAGCEKPSSTALFDAPAQARPAYYALKDAWRSRAVFVSVPENVPADGRINCDVYVVADDIEVVPCMVKVELYTDKGRLLDSSCFSGNTNSGVIGKFSCKLVGTVCFIRAHLIIESEEQTHTDVMVSSEPMLASTVLPTQLLYADGKITNVGANVAFNVSIPAVGFFGCLMPKEYIETEDDTVTNMCEGMNMFI